MKNIKLNFIYVFVCAFFLMACNKSEQEKAKGDLNETISEILPDAGEANTAISKCITEKEMKELLTPDLVNEFLGIPISEAKEDESKMIKGFYSLEYLDKKNSTRSKKMEFPKGNFTDIPVPNLVGIKYIKTTDMQTFKNFYRNATDEDLAKLEEVMNDPETKEKQMEAIDKQNLSPEMRKVVEESLKSGQDKDLARGLSAGAKERFEEASGVGEYCIWNKQDQILLVYTSNAQFGVTVNLSDDNASNKAKSISLAKKILAKCE